MRYGDVNYQPANSQAAEPEGGLYRTILESSDQGFCTIEVVFDENERPLDYRFLEVSSSFERQTGIKDAAGRWMRKIAGDQDQFWFDIYGRVARSGEPERFENLSTPANRWWSVYAFKIEGSARIAVLFDDITTRKRAEAALRASEEQFETLLHQAPLGVYLVDSDFVIREVNPVALPVFGDIPGGPIGRDFDEVIHALWDKEYADEIVGIFRGTLATGEAYVTPERGTSSRPLPNITSGGLIESFCPGANTASFATSATFANLQSSQILRSWFRQFPSSRKHPCRT